MVVVAKLLGGKNIHLKVWQIEDILQQNSVFVQLEVHSPYTFAEY
jgi:hypothetical protein